MNVAEYRALTKPKKKNGEPEHDLQVAVCKWLAEMQDLGLLHCRDWTANAAGVRVSIHVARKMKAAGVRRGWPDLQFALLDGRTAYIELKATRGLSPEQKAFRSWAEPLGIWAMAKTLDQVEAALRGWGVLQDRRAAA